MKFTLLVGDIVWRVNARRAGVVVVKLPGDERAVRRDTTLNVNHARWPEICPGKLFLAGPYQLYRFAGGFGQTSSFHGALAGVLATVRRASIGNNHPHLIERDVKCC